MRNGILLIALAFAVTLAIVVGNRLSNEATAVLVGALCGISATLPVSLALFIAMNRNWGHSENNQTIRPEYPAPRGYAPQTPVVVISPPPTAPSPYGYYGSPYFLPAQVNDAPPGAREFKIVGDE